MTFGLCFVDSFVLLADVALFSFLLRFNSVNFISMNQFSDAYTVTLLV